MNHRMLCLALLVGLAIPALGTAATTPPGMNLRWDQCFDDSGAASKSFACDTNTGSERLVLSFVLDQPMNDVSGVEMIVDFVPSSASMPLWWDLKNAGSCRRTSLVSTFLAPSGSSQCIDWAAGNAVGGIGAYSDFAFSTPPAIVKRAKLAAAVPQSALVSLAADQEYAACVLTIDHAKTVGTGSCDGCAVPVCIVFQSIGIDTPVLSNNIHLFQGANTTASQMVRWQDGVPQGTISICSPGTGCNLMFTCVPASTPTRSSTWGAVKSLYR